MLKQNKYLNIMIAVLTVTLIIAYAFIVFFPHSHECVETDGPLCAVRALSQSILLGVALAFGGCQLTKISFVILGYNDVLSIRDGTPVGLKVKLSN